MNLSKPPNLHGQKTMTHEICQRKFARVKEASLEQPILGLAEPWLFRIRKYLKRLYKGRLHFKQSSFIQAVVSLKGFFKRPP